MQVKQSKESATQVKLTVSAELTELKPIKTAVVTRLGGQLKLAGFRPGTAPLALIEKNLDPKALQTEFLNEALNQLYVAALEDSQLRPVRAPEVNVTKFVPFTLLEFSAEIEVLGSVELPDYKKIKQSKKTITVTDKDIKDVVHMLQKRLAEKKEVDRAAKNSDEVWIDFAGTDSKGQPVKGADGKDYPLILGSDTFIPGFEKNLIGMKAADEKNFSLTFPKDYAVKALSGKKVNFFVKVKKVQEILEPKADAAFAAKAGPFKSMDELKKDIKKQLTVERQNEADRAYENQLVQKITAKSKTAVPASLKEQQAERLLQDLRQNLTYRGQTYPEFLEAQGTTEDKYYKEVLLPQAEDRVKAGLVLSTIAESEGITVTNDELDERLQQLKAQYQDKAMQDELNKPQARNDIASRILTEKTVSKLVAYSANKQ